MSKGILAAIVESHDAYRRNDVELPKNVYLNAANYGALIFEAGYEDCSDDDIDCPCCVDDDPECWVQIDGVRYRCDD